MLETMHMKGALAAGLAALMAAAAILGNGNAVRAAGNTEAEKIWIAKTEGTVSVKNRTGKTQSTADGMRLFSGSNIATAAASYAWLGLDDTKSVKLDEKTDVVITKNSGNLDITLNEGRLVTDVTKPLTSEENYHIRTQDSIMGIRGSIVCAEKINEHQTAFIVLEGHPNVSVTNPVTKQTTTRQLNPGDYALLDSQVAKPNGTTTQTITVRQATRNDIGTYFLNEIAGGNVADAARERFVPGSTADILSLRIYNATNHRLDLRGELPAAKPEGVQTAEEKRKALLAAWEKFDRELKAALQAEQEAKAAAQASDDDDEEEEDKGPAYTITLIYTTTSPHNDTITISPSGARRGETVTVSISQPTQHNMDYYIWVTCNGQDYIGNSNGYGDEFMQLNYSFTMPDGPIEVRVQEVP